MLLSSCASGNCLAATPVDSTGGRRHPEEFARSLPGSEQEQTILRPFRGCGQAGIIRTCTVPRRSEGIERSLHVLVAGVRLQIAGTKYNFPLS